jgi:HD-GYP domain-containing protein (c-di-GMP phosphodiesterase class II)
LADVLDAMLSDRPYKKGQLPDKALEIVRSEFEKDGLDKFLCEILLEDKDEALKKMLEELIRGGFFPKANEFAGEKLLEET